MTKAEQKMQGTTLHLADYSAAHMTVQENRG